MKQFIYLDTDIVNSIIAQEEKGIITQHTLTNDSVDSQDESQRKSISGDAKVGGHLFKIVETSGEVGVSRDIDKGHNITNSTSDVIEKIMHDSAFDIANEYIKPYEVAFGKQEYDEEGNYVSIKRVFDFVDFEYLDKLISQNGLIDFIKKNDEKQIRLRIENEAEDIYNREQKRTNKSEIEKVIKDEIKTNNQQYDDATKMIELFRVLVPYNQMLISHDGYLVPLDEKYFRIDPRNLGFKYGGEITCVGMVTNIFGEDTNPNDENNIFATIQYAATETLRLILPTKENNICVIHPIAVYYGS